jgi:hypothetical protein
MGIGQPGQKSSFKSVLQQYGHIETAVPQVISRRHSRRPRADLIKLNQLIHKICGGMNIPNPGTHQSDICAPGKDGSPSGRESRDGI